MPKRSSDEDSEKYIRRKMRKLEKKLRKRKKRSYRRRSNSDCSESMPEIVPPVLSPIEDSQELTEGNIVSNQQRFDIFVQDATAEPVDTAGSPDPALTGSPAQTPQPAPSVSAPPDPEDCCLDDDILELLGASPSLIKKKGDNVQKDIALRWEHIATSGLTKETRKELLGKHLVPGNCPKLAAPLLNPEIKAAISDTLMGKDKASENRQSQLTSIISCIGEALTKILNSDHKDSSVLKPLLEGGQLLCDLQYSESMKRRSFICASIKKEIKNQLYETEIDTFLFGENLPDTLKAAKAINKSGSEIKAANTKSAAARNQSRNLNSKSQLANSRQSVKRGQRPAPYPQRQFVMPPPLPAPPQQRYYQTWAQAPPPPPPPPPLPPLSKQRPYQRR